MELLLKNKKQHAIADLLWAADSQEQVQEIIQRHGRVAIVVRDMMLAAAMDEVMDTDLAANVLKGF